MKIFKLKQKERLYTPSKAWREMYSSLLLDTLPAMIDIESITEMYSVVFFLASEKNFVKAKKYIEYENMSRLAKMIELIPTDFDENFYDMYDIVYVHSVRKFLLITLKYWQDDNIKLEIKYIKEIDEIELSEFMGRSLIFPTESK